MSATPGQHAEPDPRSASLPWPPGGEAAYRAHIAAAAAAAPLPPADAIALARRTLGPYLRSQHATTPSSKGDRAA